MSTLIIGLGQAGTSISIETSSLLKSKLPNNSFITPNNCTAKLFLIDTEKKAISNQSKLHPEISKYLIKDVNMITNSSGRGNNWALGHSNNFKEFKTEKNINQDALDHIQNFMEKCDFINTLIVSHSLNGGTGSGCGSRLIENLRNIYGKMKIISAPVFGFDLENTTLSLFNQFFTIGTIYDKVDLIFRIQNEKFKTSFDKCNKTIAQLLSDYIFQTEKGEIFNIDKYYQKNKFVEFNFASYNYIMDYSKMSTVALDNVLFQGEKNGILTFDSIFKTNSNNNKEYLEYYNSLKKYKGCNVSKSIYEQNK
ncbi:MAG: hypothetical protein MJ252_03115, partial [archaeon]|nr:hypothetical protein [archaeon]